MTTKTTTAARIYAAVSQPLMALREALEQGGHPPSLIAKIAEAQERAASGAVEAYKAGNKR